MRVAGDEEWNAANQELQSKLRAFVAAAQAFMNMFNKVISCIKPVTAFTLSVIAIIDIMAQHIFLFSNVNSMFMKLNNMSHFIDQDIVHLCPVFTTHQHL